MVTHHFMGTNSKNTPFQSLFIFPKTLYAFNRTYRKGNYKRMQKQALTINEAAEYSGIGRNSLRTLVRWGKIPVIQIGNKTIIRTETLDLFLATNEGKNLKNIHEVIAV